MTHKDRNLQSLQFPPKLGDIVMCEFPDCFGPPEMVKTRAVIVISPRRQNECGLATVVPLSNSAPEKVCDHHCQIPVKLLPKHLQATGGARWAKCDMLYTLSTKRLFLVSRGRDPQTKKRVYDTARIDLEHIQAVRRCISAALVISPDIFLTNQDDAATPLAIETEPAAVLTV